MSRILSTGAVPGPGGAWSRGVPGGDPLMATAAGGTHYTGMRSCFSMDHVRMTREV